MEREAQLTKELQTLRRFANVALNHAKERHGSMHEAIMELGVDEELGKMVEALISR
jgi:hypothetical protein